MKDEFCRVGGIFDYPLNHDLITSVKAARGKYISHLEAKKELEEKQNQEQLKIKTEEAKWMETKSELENIDTKMKVKNSELQVAYDSINEGKMKLQKVLKEGKLCRKDIPEAPSLIDMGTERKHKVEEEIKQLDNKKQILLK